MVNCFLSKGVYSTKAPPHCTFVWKWGVSFDLHIAKSKLERLQRKGEKRIVQLLVSLPLGNEWVERKNLWRMGMKALPADGLSKFVKDKICGVQFSNTWLATFN